MKKLAVGWSPSSRGGGDRRRARDPGAPGPAGCRRCTGRAAQAQPVVELAATDVVRAELRELQRGLPVSGSLKAVNSAFVKARVPANCRGSRCARATPCRRAR